MQENLLQYIWQFQYFNHATLLTTAGENIQIIHPGSHNQNQGPDFTAAKIKIGETVWVGNVEIHINSSGWNLHHHSDDSNFNNVILHVVWNNDTAINDRNGIPLPALELKSRVSKLLMEKYKTLMQSSHFIPCEKQVQQINQLSYANWKQRLVAERLISRSSKIFSILQETNFHWEETFWQLIASNFGLKVNNHFFQQIARYLPVTVLAKHKNRIQQIEALLFGVAGLLNEDFKDKYPLMLQKEYTFYKKKYGLKEVDGELSFLRMRPANFPTVRLAQLSMLIHESEHLFSKIRNAKSAQEIKKKIAVTANDYWHYHYVFDEESDFKKKQLGGQMINNIIINTVVPALFAYGVHHNEDIYKDRALKWLEDISAEKNSIIKGFENLSFINKNAFDSQFFIQLKNEYCNNKLCLKCAIGNALLKRSFSGAD